MRRFEKVGLLNLGCARNLVDAEEILGRLRGKGFQVSEVPQADIVVVNTCSFIEAAKKESIDAILDLIELKRRGKIKKIIVAGCLAQRYGTELLAEFKEIDALSGILPLNVEQDPARYPLSPGYSSYVKICESCFNHCSFCVIPQIKGRFVSRSIESILTEVRRLDLNGAKEINLIGQDISAYGMDIDRRLGLARLLEAMDKEVRNIQWIRLLYAYPSHITDELLEVIARKERLCKYLDLPLQHIAERILKAMGRRLGGRATRALIKKIRRCVPDIRLRTTFIVGFPGETEEEFAELRDFVREARFDKLGVFTYSREEGTKAYSLPGQIPERVKKHRQEILMKEQRQISQSLLAPLLGQSFKVLIDGNQEGEENIYLGRTEFDAPEVDGLVYVHSKRRLKAGDFITAVVKDTLEYDLMATVLTKQSG